MREKGADCPLAARSCPFSTGALEASNNKIGALQRRAYGFRDREYFVLQIHSLHLKKYALVG